MCIRDRPCSGLAPLSNEVFALLLDAALSAGNAAPGMLLGVVYNVWLQGGRPDAWAADVLEAVQADVEAALQAAWQELASDEKHAVALLLSCSARNTQRGALQLLLCLILSRRGLLCLVNPGSDLTWWLRPWHGTRQVQRQQEEWQVR